MSFVVGYAAIAWLLRYVSHHSYLPFVIYRIGLGTLILVLRRHRRDRRLTPSQSQPERLKNTPQSAARD